MSRDDEFAKLAAEYEAAKEKAEVAKIEEARVCKLADSQRLAVEAVAKKLRECVGANIPTRNAMVNGKLVRVEYRKEGDTRVTVEDVTTVKG